MGLRNGQAWSLGGFRMSRFSFANMRYRTQKKIIIGVFLFIPVALLMLLCISPVAQMIFYSLTDWNGYSRKFKFVLFRNYIQIFTNPEQVAVLKTSLYYIGGTFLQTILALYFATVLSFHIKVKNFFKACLFFPYLVNGVAIGFIFLLFYEKNGMLDFFLKTVGLGKIVTKWLGNPAVVNFSLVGASIWRYMGFSFVIFVGAVSSVPQEIYEAAEIDGTSGWQKFMYIIIPSISQVVFINFIVNLSGALSIYELPYIMTAGTNGSRTFVMNILDTAFRFNKYGLASAMSVFLLALILFIVFLQQKFLIRED
jgi:multiple sugar transport system permease protein